MNILDRYIRWALQQKHYMLFGFWLPFLVIVAVVTVFYIATR